MEDFVPPPPPAPKATLHALFFGDDGLRAGWSFLLFFVLLTLTVLGGGWLVHHFHLIPKTDGTAKTGQTTLAPRAANFMELSQFLVFAIPALLMSLIERRPFARYGLSLRRMLPDFLTGLAWGFVLLSALIGALYLTHAIAFDGVALHGAVALTFAAKWLWVFFLVGLAEEFVFRGYFQYTLARGIAGITRTMDPENRYAHLISFWSSAVIFSLGLFMRAHIGNGGETFTGILAVGLAGIVFAFSLYRTGSLWWAIGLHTSWDWAQSYFYGTADSGNIAVGHLLNSHPIGSKFLSGGLDGPEGSILCIPTLLLVALVIHVTLPKRAYPITPDQSLPEKVAAPKIVQIRSDQNQDLSPIE